MQTEKEGGEVGSCQNLTSKVKKGILQAVFVYTDIAQTYNNQDLQTVQYIGSLTNYAI